MTQLTISEGFIFTASDDGTVHRFDAHGRRVCTFAGHSGGVWALGINGSTLITGSTDKMARIWNTSNGQALHVLRGHRATIRAVALLSGGRVATASRDHTIVVWSFNGERLHLFAGHAQAVRCLDAADDLIVSGSYDCTVKLWDARRGRFLRDLCTHNRRVYAVRIAGGFVASAGLDATVCVTSLDGSVLCGHTCHSAVVAWLDFEGRFLVSSGSDGAVVVYDCVARSVVYIIQETSPIKCQRVSGGLLVVGTITEVRAYAFATGRFLRRLVAAHTICKVEIDGSRIIVGFCLDGDYQVSIFDYASAFTCRKA